MAATYELIESQTLGAAAASVTFSSIPGTFDDLCVLHSARTTRVSVVEYFGGQINGSSSNMTTRLLEGSGSTASSSSGSFIRLGVAAGSSATADTFGNTEIWIPNYAGSTNKSISWTGVQETNATGASIVAGAVLWSQTAAITSISFSSVLGNNIVTGSSFHLYGITKA